MKFKKIMSLLLVLTLIGTMLTTVTLLNPVAEDTEATTPAETTNYDIHVLHAKGAANATTRGIYLNIASAAKIKVGKTYTVSVVFQSSKRFNDAYHCFCNITLSAYRHIFKWPNRQLHYFF